MKIPETGGGLRDDQMKRLYPEIEPYDQGMREVGDGNSIYWALSGNPKGRSVIVLHGGPGSGSSANIRRFFDPQHYRIIQFDQRGCGKSQPNAADPQTDMSVNTTWHLVRDMERLRIFFGVERWLVFGHSWGCTLALVYAQQHAERIAGLVVAGITMTRQSEIDCHSSPHGNCRKPGPKPGLSSFRDPLTHRQAQGWPQRSWMPRIRFVTVDR